MTKHTRSKQGYTLIEALVAMGIFVLIAVLGTGIFTSILRAQTRTLQQQGTAQELRFFQDVISRDIRGAKTVSCEDPEYTYFRSIFKF
jgi:prepilin-type N-terminal cleavage/methylation domain-containing protein